MCFKIFQKKSFDLINEEEAKLLKETNRCSWLRFLIIPGLICFALILILVNVDFSENEEDFINTNTTTENSFQVLNSTVVWNNKHDFVSNRSIFQNSSILRIDVCSTISYDDCKLLCKVFAEDRSNLNNNLKSQAKICKIPMDVRLELSSFKDSTFNKADLNGDFRIVNLTFYLCFLDKIADNAFDKPSLNDLENLIIKNSRLEIINDKTFAGLNKLKYFEMTNTPPILTMLKADSILKPIAKTLQKFIFLADTYKRQIEQNPNNWFNGAELIELRYVDIQNHYFCTILNKNSFKALKRVEYLNLHACNISFLPENTFDPILSTLRFLNLSENNLIHLSPYMLKNMINFKVELTLTNNYWDCSCLNYEFIEEIRKGDIILSEDPKCYKPNELKDLSMKLINICCADDKNDCKTETTSTTSLIRNTITTEMMDSTTEIVNTTTGVYTTTEVHITTLTSNKTTINSQNTTEIITITTENIADDFPKIELSCKHWPNKQQTTIITINDQLVDFKIATISATSVKITLKAIPAGASLLYFKTQKIDNAKYENLRDPIITVKNLTINETYIFCIVPLENELLSPFNCLAHCMKEFRIREEEAITAWLTNKTVPLFIALTVFGVIVCLLIGVISMYLLLRWRPTLLRNKRLIKLKRDSKKAFLKKNHSIFTNDDEAYNALRNYADVYELNLNDYVKYYSGAALPITRNEISNSLENLPPIERAPAKPPTYSTQSKIATYLAPLQTIPEDFNEHEYQSLEDYQNIYELNCENKNF